jgi:6-pyruvoyl-tetrahydropterin synthase
MTESVVNFPSQAVSDLEKMTPDYGLKVARAIYSEWFDENNSKYKYYTTNFHKLRLYARGEQPIEKYKNEISINGDLSYLNLDWKPVPIVSKFVDIVVNGMSQRVYEINAHSKDKYGVYKRTEYMDSMLTDIRARDFSEAVEANLDINIYENNKETLPETEEELLLHMQLSYKQAVEIAEEQAINTLFEDSNYDLVKRRCLYDLVTIGMGATKTSFNFSEGVKIEYVDPADLVYSYTDSPYFEDIYYVGEVKCIPINELVKQFPELTETDVDEILSQSYDITQYRKDKDRNEVHVLYFNWKTHQNNTYKLKSTSTGADKVIMKDDTFNPPENMEGNFSKLQKAVECLYEGVYILGANKLLRWRKAPNMMKNKSNVSRVKMNYNIVAPRIYDGRVQSLVNRITGFADMIQLTHLKIQQVMNRMVPDGVYLDADGLAEIDLGNGTNYNPQEALNMFFQTGSVIGRSFTSDGDLNPGKVPIQQIQNGSGSNKLQTLITTYNYYLQMIRDVTGLNEARDGSMPDKNALVGVQKLAAANSNTATRHILQAMLYLTAEVAESLSLRVSDIVEYSPTKENFIQSIGSHNVATLSELSQLHMHDFGIYINLMPDEEEKQMLENNIQVALAQKLIDLDDAIDIREVKNIKLANQLLKVKRKNKQKRDQLIQQQNIQAQSQANAQSQQVAAQAEVQKNQAKANTEMQLEQQKNELKLQYLQEEARVKKELMKLEFELNAQLEQNKGETIKKFESSGNDIVTGEVGI